MMMVHQRVEGKGKKRKAKKKKEKKKIWLGQQRGPTDALNAL